MCRFFSLLLAVLWPLGGWASAEIPRVAISSDGKGFVFFATGKPFVPWGFNYDHDNDGNLLEDYWETRWPEVEQHFGQMKQLGATVVRVHLQLGKFLSDAETPDRTAIAQLERLVALAERTGLYLDLTGLGCYHKRDIPAWYDRLDERGRWEAQAVFWRAMARVGAKSSAIFCYDLMNEPVSPAGKQAEGNWLGPPFGDKHFVQWISLDAQGRSRPDIAVAWVHKLTVAIRQVDRRTMITVGMVDWSLDRPGLTSGFVPEKLAPHLDFLSVHIYPEKGKVDEALTTLKGFAVGKPVVLEETAGLRCTTREFAEFLEGSRQHAAGWMGFYWGKPPDLLRKSDKIGDGMLLDWIEALQQHAHNVTP